jgi:HTH-type transcriptional regulator/antitoxin HipB
MRARTTTDVGNLIRERRRQLGMSQAALARDLGVSRQWLISVEAGKEGADTARVLRLLTALGLVVDIRPIGADAGARVPPGDGQQAVSVDIDALIDLHRGGA